MQRSGRHLRWGVLSAPDFADFVSEVSGFDQESCHSGNSNRSLPITYAEESNSGIANRLPRPSRISPVACGPLLLPPSYRTHLRSSSRRGFSTLLLVPTLLPSLCLCLRPCPRLGSTHVNLGRIVLAHRARSRFLLTLPTISRSCSVVASSRNFGTAVVAIAS